MMSVVAGTCSLVWRDQCQVMGGFIQQQHLLQQHDITTDVTIVSDDGLVVSAHSLVLAACSPFFSAILKSTPTNDMSISLLDTTSSQLQSILAFIYTGETIISKDSLDNFLALVRHLQISCFNKNQKVNIESSADDNDDLDQFYLFIDEENVSAAQNENSSIFMPPLDQKLVLTDLIRTNSRKERWILPKKNARRHLETNFSYQNLHMIPGSSNTEAMSRHFKKPYNIAEEVSSVEIEKSSCVTPLVDHKPVITAAIRTNLNEVHLPIEEEVSSVDINRSSVLIPSVNHKTMLAKLIKSNLRKEVEDERIYWHCLCCDKRWNVTKKNAYRHMETHLPKQECVNCGKTFTNTEAMKRHLKKEHNNNNVTEFISLKLRTDLADMNDHNTNVEQLSMDVNDGVDLPIRNANMKMTNMRSYEGQKTYLTSFKMVKVETETDGKRENSWQCLICGKSWHSKFKCSRHMEAHMVGLEFPCESCNKIFDRKKTLKKHRELCGEKLMNSIELEIVEDILEMVEVNIKERNKKERETFVK